MALLTLLTPPQRDAVRVNIVRLIELTARISSVIRQTDADISVRIDPIAYVLRTFSRVYHLNSDCTLAVAKEENFGDTVATQAAESSSDLTVIPWTIIQSGEEDDLSEVALLDELENNRSQTQYIRSLFKQVHGPIAVAVDRGLGNPGHRTRVVDEHGAVQAHPTSELGQTCLFRMLFTGGEDDRIALQIAQLIALHNQKVQVIRLQNTIIGETNAIPDPDDEKALKECNLSVTTVSSETELIESVKDLDHWDAIILGRGDHDRGRVLGNLSRKLAESHNRASLIVVRASLPLDPTMTGIESMEKGTYMSRQSTSGM